MSLESKIDTLNATIVALIQQLQVSAPQAANTMPVAAAQPVQSFAPMTPAAAPVTVPTAAPVVMPPAPTFAAPAPVAQAAPFTDTASLVAYAMGVYTTLGAEKGAGIQNIITSMGKQNINDITPDQYPQFYAAVEALKAA